MPTRIPRINVTLEPSLYLSLKLLAEKEGTSLSMKARDLIRDALEEYEDDYWVSEAKKREGNFREDEALSHKEIWGG